MASFGNHLKMNMLASLRPRAIEFYVKILGCAELKSPLPDLDLFGFQGGFVLGIFYFDDAAHVLSDSEQMKATWLEIKTKNVELLKKRLQKFGVREIDYEDKSRFYFQAPGGPVFRLAPMDGGI